MSRANAMRYRQLQASVLLTTDATTRANYAQTMASVLATVDKGWTTYAPTIDPG